MRLAIAVLLSAAVCFGAISGSTAWEVRTTGADTSGGGFVAGAAGTDLSQFDSKNAAACSNCQSATINISTTDAVAVGSTTITSATGNFSAAIVGNIVEFAGGTGSITAVWKQVTGFTNATTITIDSLIASSTGMTMNIGGALATITKALAVSTTSNIIFVKATATYTITAGMALANNMTPINAAPPNQLIGYTATRTDGGRATIQFSTNANITGIDGTNAGGWYISNFVIDCNSLGASLGVRVNVNSVLRNLKIQNCAAIGANLANGTAQIMDSELTGNTAASTNGVVNSGGNSTVARCYIHDNTGTGLLLSGGGSTALLNVIASNSNVGGADGSGNGILVNGAGLNTILNNTIYNNGRDGIQFSSNTLGANGTVRNNLLISNTRYGLNGYLSGAGWGKFPQWDGNAYFGNGTAARNNADDTGSTNPINAANPYSNTLDVTLTGSPFTNAAGHDFTLNSTAGAGASANGAGTPGAIPGLVQTGSVSFGAFQPAVPAGGGGGCSFQSLILCKP